MNCRLIRALSLALVVLLVLPTLAVACPIPLRRVGPLPVRMADLKRPSLRMVNRAEWRVDDTWTTTYPELNQTILVRGFGTVDQVSFPGQRILSIDATAPGDYGWKYDNDALDTTPPCAVAGQGEWQAPVIMVKENTKLVRIAAVARRTPGDRAGCVLMTDGERGCPALTRTLLRLKAPMGVRKLQFELLSDPVAQ